MRLEISTTLTERDKKLLSFLGVVLVCAFFWFFVISPLKENYEMNQALLADEEVKKHTNATKETLYEDLLEYDIEMEEKADESASAFFSLMSSDEIDELLTDLALSCDLRSTSLSIEMPTEEAELSAYRYAETDEESETAASSIARSLYGVDGEETADTSGEEEAGTVSAGVYKATASMELAGTEKNLKKMIDALNENYDAILVTGYSFSDTLHIYTGSADGEESEAQGEKILAIDVDVYMYATKEEASQIQEASQLQKGAEE